MKRKPSATEIATLVAERKRLMEQERRCFSELDRMAIGERIKIIERAMGS